MSHRARVRYSRDSYLKQTHVQPRLHLGYLLTAAVTLRGSYGRYHQLPPIDQIVPVKGNPDLRAPTATHYVLGSEWRLADEWSMKTDLYYKDISQLVVNVDDARNYINGASGKAYGVEVMLERKPVGNGYGWASLSDARSKRTNDLTGRASLPITTRRWLPTLY